MKKATKSRPKPKPKFTHESIALLRQLRQVIEGLRDHAVHQAEYYDSERIRVKVEVWTDLLEGFDTVFNPL